MDLKALTLAARKAGDKKKVVVLGVIAGELARMPTKEYTADQAYGIVRKLIKNATDYPTADSAEELRILNSLLPAELTDEQIWEAVKQAKQIAEVKNYIPAGVDKAKAIALWRQRNA